jgi:hypothetical protein
MSNSNESSNKELAERLCDQQGKPQDHSTGEWLEAEYRAHPPIATVPNEVDLRMRGLGPLTRNDPAEPPAAAPSSKTSMQAAGSILLVAGVCVGVGILYSILRGLRPDTGFQD